MGKRFENEKRTPTFCDAYELPASAQDDVVLSVAHQSDRCRRRFAVHGVGCFLASCFGFSCIGACCFVGSCFHGCCFLASCFAACCFRRACRRLSRACRRLSRACRWRCLRLSRACLRWAGRWRCLACLSRAGLRLFLRHSFAAPCRAITGLNRRHLLASTGVFFQISSNMYLNFFAAG